MITKLPKKRGRPQKNIDHLSDYINLITSNPTKRYEVCQTVELDNQDMFNYDDNDLKRIIQEIDSFNTQFEEMDHQQICSEIQNQYQDEIPTEILDKMKLLDQLGAQIQELRDAVREMDEKVLTMTAKQKQGKKQKINPKYNGRAKKIIEPFLAMNLWPI